MEDAERRGLGTRWQRVRSRRLIEIDQEQGSAGERRQHVAGIVHVQFGKPGARMLVLTRCLAVVIRIRMVTGRRLLRGGELRHSRCRGARMGSRCGLAKKHQNAGNSCNVSSDRFGSKHWLNISHRRGPAQTTPVPGLR